MSPRYFTISIHALLAESDLSLRVSIFGSPSFLSTLSLRRATMILLPCAAQATHFYPRSPCGERHNLNLDWILETLISIHALLAESDPPPFCWGGIMSNFYPRSPCGERPPRAGHCRGCDGISIHALLAESDAGRQPVLVQIVEFLSTLSLRRATARQKAYKASCVFLSTLSLRRATINALGAQIKTIFLSTLSLRRATKPIPVWLLFKLFLSTLSLRRAT